MEMKSIESVIKLWREQGYTAYVRSLQNTWFINWDDKKSVAFTIEDDKCDYKIAGFKPTVDEVKQIKNTAATFESVHLKNRMGNEHKHYENHVTNNA